MLEPDGEGAYALPPRYTVLCRQFPDPSDPQRTVVFYESAHARSPDALPDWMLLVDWPVSIPHMLNFRMRRAIAASLERPSHHVELVVCRRDCPEPDHAGYAEFGSPRPMYFCADAPDWPMPRNDVYDYYHWYGAVYRPPTTPLAGIITGI